MVMFATENRFSSTIFELNITKWLQFLLKSLKKTTPNLGKFEPIFCREKKTGDVECILIIFQDRSIFSHIFRKVSAIVFIDVTGLSWKITKIPTSTVFSFFFLH